MCCNSPDVAPRVLHRGVSIAIRHVDGSFYGKSASLERSSIGLVSSLHIDIQEGFPCFACRAAIADQDQRVANPHFSWGANSHFAVGAEDQFEEADDPSNVLSEHPRDNGWPAIWLNLVISQVSPRVKLSWRVEPRNYPVTCRTLYYHFPPHPAGLGTCRDGLLWGMSTHRLGCCRGLGQ